MAEVLALLYAAAVASSAAIATVLLLRAQLRRLFGSVLAYLAWCSLPAALLAVLMPRPDGMASELAVPGDFVRPVTNFIVGVTTSTSGAASLLFWGWAAGMAAAVAVMALQQRRFVRGLGLLAPVNGVAYSVRRGISPAVVGLLRPVIVLPADFEERYTPQERALILAHERAHVRRGDLVANALWSLIRCLLWFNPLTHLATTHFRFDQELACDASTLRDPRRSRKIYATAMLKTLLPDPGAPISSAWRTSDPLRQRLLGLRKMRHSVTRRALGASLTFALLGSAAYVSWAVQPLTAYRLATRPPPTMCPLEAKRRQLQVNAGTPAASLH